MRTTFHKALIFLAVLTLGSAQARAQWKDPRLIAGQVAFHVAVSFVGKLLHEHQPPGRALKSALVEGTASGLVAHSGYCIAGQHPHLALIGKTLAQKSALMTRRSIAASPVFDRSLYRHWQLTHCFLYFELKDGARVEIDVLNAAVGGYFLASDDYDFDFTRTLTTGSLFFRRANGPESIRGFTLPGVIWVDSDCYDDQGVIGHELIHALQNERGAAVKDWHYKGLRFNWLALAPGVPSLLRGWPEHDRRLHEREAELYARRP